MTAAERKRFVTAIRVLAKTYAFPLDDEVLLAYRQGLDGMTIEDIETAARLALRSSKWMPKPAELRELAERPARRTAAPNCPGCGRSICKCDAVPPPEEALEALEAVFGKDWKLGDE